MRKQPATMTSEQTIDSFSAYAPALLTEMDSLFSAHVCARVLDDFKLQTKIVSVIARAMNRVYVERMTRMNRDVTQADVNEWATAGGWASGTLAIDKPWSGHLIVLVGKKWIVDPASRLLARPDRGLLVPSIFVGEASGKFVAGDGSSTYPGPNGEVLSYSVRAGDMSWQELQYNDAVQNTAREIVSRMRGAQ